MNTKRRAASLLLGVIVGACAGSPASATSAGSPLPQIPHARATPATAAGRSMTIAAEPPTPALASAVKFPVRADYGRASVLLSPGGIVYAVAPGGTNGTVIAALDDKGRPRPGWPVAIPGAYVPSHAAFAADGTLYLPLDLGERAALTALRQDGRVAAGWPVRLGSRDSCVVLPADDGTVRVLCGIRGDGARAYAFDRRGRALPGWPVELAGSDSHLYPATPILVGTTLIGLQGGHGWVRRYRIDVDGTLHFGKKVTAPVYDSPCYDDRHWAPMSFLGPDGTAYLWWYRMGLPDGPDACRFISSTYTAFDARGVRDGWPVTVAGESSEPVLGPDGRIYATQGSQERHPTRISAFDARGRRVAGWPVTIDVAPAIGQGGEGWWPPAAVFVGDDGTVYLITESGGTTIYALGPGGKVLRGWPYRSASALGDTATPCATGGGHPIVVPVIDAAGRLHIVHRGADLAYGFEKDSRVTLVDDGHTVRGWPVTLRRAGSRFVSLAVDARGVTYALALEYEGPLRCDPSPKSSETLLAIAVDGSVLYRTTLLEPGS